MKKVLRLISLMLIMVMILPLIPVEIFAGGITATTPPVVTNTDGSKIYTVNGYKKAAQDGTINPEEYSVTANLDAPVAASSTISFDALTAIPETDTLRSEEMSVSFSHTAEKIYIGVYDKSGAASKLNGYALRLGFDEENTNNTVGIAVRFADYVYAQSTKTTLANLNKTWSGDGGYSNSQGSRLGMARSNGDYKWDVTKGPGSETGYNNYYNGYSFGSGSKYTSVLYHTDNKDTTYPITAMTMQREDVNGNEIKVGSSGRITTGQYYTYWEIEIDKARLLDYYNGMGNAEYDFKTLPDTMLFSLQQMEVNPDTTTGTFYMWNGSFDDDHSTKDHALMAYNYDKVVFNDYVPSEDSTSNIYTVNGYKKAAQDGAIGVNEYSAVAKLKAPVAASSTITFDALTTIPETDTLRSEEMSVSFSHTVDKIYIGVYDKSGTANILNGYSLRLGFDEENPNNIVGMTVRMADYTANGSKTTVAKLNKTYSEYAWAQGARFGMVRSNGSYVWNCLFGPSSSTLNPAPSTYTANGSEYTSILCHEDTKDTTYPITAMTMLREDVDGVEIKVGSSGRITSGQHYTYWEIEIDKDRLLDYYNGMYEEGEQFETLPETMMFSLQQMEVNPSTTTNTFYIWNGSFNDDHATKDNAMMAYNYDKVVFNSPCVENGHTTSDDGDCTTEVVCSVCKEVVIPAKEHTWSDATCTAPKTCSVCQATEGEAAGHKWTDADCDTPKTCSVCQATEGEVAEHTWDDADCDTPKTCSVCGATEGEAAGHKWSDATCTAPKTCSVCQATEGEVAEHTWDDADCDTPKTCSVCGATEGEAAGHKWADATCTAPKTCSVCGTTEGEVLDHNFTGAWSKDADGHWHVCANDGCTVTDTKAGHVYDNDTDASCNDCGYVREVTGGGEPGGDIGGGDDVGGTTPSNSQTITSIGGSVDIDVTVTYDKNADTVDESPVYYVTITWEDMTFEYNSAAVEYSWNPETLEYDISTTTSDGRWTEKTAKIYIENRSNAAITVSASWRAEDGVEVAPVISGSVSLESAVGCVGTGRTGEITVSNPITGSISGDCKLGTIVLEIKAAD